MSFVTDISERCERDPDTDEIKGVKIMGPMTSTNLLADYDRSVRTDFNMYTPSADRTVSTIGTLNREV